MFEVSSTKMDSIVLWLEFLRSNELLDFKLIGPKIDQWAMLNTRCLQIMKHLSLITQSYDVSCSHPSLRSMRSFAVNPLSRREKQP